MLRFNFISASFLTGCQGKLMLLAQNGPAQLGSTRPCQVGGWTSSLSSSTVHAQPAASVSYWPEQKVPYLTNA